MSTDEKKDPMEGFNVVDYDNDAENVTIEIHPLVIKYSHEALGKKIVEIIDGGPNVKSVTIVPRKV